MTYRHIVMRHPAKLSTTLEQLVIKQDEKVTIPL